jgi:signal transduction histidine kinase
MITSHERELQQANQALQREIDERNRAAAALCEANQRKNEFLATLAHELRNPLAPIRNALEIMRLGVADPVVLEPARAMVERQVLRLVRLIDDLLDISRLGQGKLTLKKSPIVFQKVIEQALELCSPAIQRAGLTLQLIVPKIPIRLEGDLVRLTQVVSNILNNAAKYSQPGGKIRLKVEREGHQVLLQVRDKGMGLPPEMLGQIFELFTQVDRTLNRSEGGLGIGLGLARRLVEMHGGTLDAYSEGLNKGMEFTVRLPLLPTHS